MTPLEITMLLHFFAIVTPFRNIDAPAQQEAVDRFLRHDLIYPVYDASAGRIATYRTTEKGRKFVELFEIFGGALMLT